MVDRSSRTEVDRRLRVLLLEDSEDEAEILLRELAKSGYEVESVRVFTREGLEGALGSDEWDVVLADWSMPSFDGLAAYRVMRGMGRDIPFIIVSGSLEERDATNALRAGIADFVPKDNFARLLPAIEREMRRVDGKRRLLDHLVDSVPDGVIVMDARGRIVTWNRAAAEVVRLREEALEDVAHDRTKVFFLGDGSTPCESDELPLARALRGIDVDSEDVVMRAGRPPTETWLNVSARPVLALDGAIEGAVAVFRDVTKERAARDQAVVADRMASIGLLAAGVGHEINNPLAAVLANLDLAERALRQLEVVGDGHKLDDARIMIAEASAAAQRVRVIARDLRMFARHDEGKATAVDVERVLESTLRMARPEVRHRAQVVTDYASPPPVLGTDSRLGQVFLNLIVNAAQAIPEGHVTENTITIRTRVAPDGHVLVEIADTGPGIPRDILRQIFTPFFTTKAPGTGTGLGLAISHRIVASLGGAIEVESTVGAGTTFRVLLPAAERPVSIPVATSEVPVSTRRGRVLVIDDEPMIASVVTRSLRAEHDVITTTRAVEALERLRSGESFDVILCDLMMPEMSGIEFHAELAELDHELAEEVIFVTGGAFTPGAREFLDRIPNDRLTKPFDVATLRALVNDRVR